MTVSSTQTHDRQDLMMLTLRIYSQLIPPRDRVHKAELNSKQKDNNKWYVVICLDGFLNQNLTAYL